MSVLWSFQELHGRHLCLMGREAQRIDRFSHAQLKELLKDAEKKFETPELSATEAQRTVESSDNLRGQHSPGQTLLFLSISVEAPCSG